MTRGILRSERGSILLLAAFSMPIMIGIAALALDGGHMFDQRQRQAGAADAAALGGAREILRSPSLPIADLRALARHEATLTGFTNGADGVTVTINRPPATGPFAGNNFFVEAIITQPVSTFLMQVFGTSTMTVAARAVAGVDASSGNCIIALNPTGTGLAIDKNTTINAPGCHIAVNSASTSPAAMTVLGHTHVDVGPTGSIGVGGSISLAGDSTLSPTPITPMPPAVDPLAYLTPLTPGTCIGPTPYLIPDAVTVTLNPGTYCGLKIMKLSTVNFNPGNYIITGSTGFIIGKQNILNGTGVTFHNVGTGPVTMDSDGQLNVTAPTSGAYRGILFYQKPSNTQIANFDKMNDYNISGAFYFPGAHVILGKHGGVASDCIQVVAKSVQLISSFSFANECSAYGGSALHAPALAE